VIIDRYYNASLFVFRLKLNFWGHLFKYKSIIKGNSVVMQKLMAACSDSKMNIGEKENANHKERKLNSRNV